MFTFYTPGLRRAFPRHGNEHVLAGHFEQKGPGQGKGPSALPGESLCFCHGQRLLKLWRGGWGDTTGE